MDFVKIAQELKESVVKTNKYIGVSDNTVKNYIAKLKFFEKKEVLNADLPEFINKIVNLNSRSANQIAVLGTAKHSPTFKELITQDVLDIITKQNEELMNEIRGKVGNTQTKTEKQEENWINLKELKKLFKERKTEFSIQDQLLIAMYTLMPPARLDYHQVKIIRTQFIDPKTELPEGVTSTDNFLRIYKKSGRNYTDLHLKEYKTSATYGDFKERLPKPVTDLILQLPVTQEYLFQKKSGGGFSSPETYGVYLRSVFNKLTGKNLSVDLLRSIYLTDFRKGEKSIVKKQAVARKMMNSVEVQNGYVKVN